MSLLAPWNIPDQGTLWPEEDPGLAYAIRRHLATELHWDLRIRVRNVLFSWCVLSPIEKQPKPLRAVWTDFHDPKGLLHERVIPAGKPDAGPTFVEDTGFVQMNVRGDGSQEQAFIAAYLKGMIEFELSGFVLNGRLRLTQEREQEWSLRCLRLSEPPSWLGISCLTGRDFDDLKSGQPSWLSTFTETKAG